MLVSGSIYQACKFYELFAKTDLKGKCAIVTSYAPTIADIKGEETGEGETEKLRKYDIYRRCWPTGSTSRRRRPSTRSRSSRRR